MEILRDRTNKVIGFINVTDPNGSQELRDPGNRIVGRYDASRDTTLDPSGARVGSGNLLLILLN